MEIGRAVSNYIYENSTARMWTEWTGTSDSPRQASDGNSDESYVFLNTWITTHCSRKFPMKRSVTQRSISPSRTPRENHRLNSQDNVYLLIIYIYGLFNDAASSSGVEWWD
jgi:hypothetical protein